MKVLAYITVIAVAIIFMVSQYPANLTAGPCKSGIKHKFTGDNSIFCGAHTANCDSGEPGQWCGNSYIEYECYECKDDPKGHTCSNSIMKLCWEMYYCECESINPPVCATTDILVHRHETFTYRQGC